MKRPNVMVTKVDSSKSGAAKQQVSLTNTTVTVYIRTDDGGNTPHFHIWDSSTRGEKFSTCICITEPKYFHHEGKMDILNSKQLKALVKLLKGPSINKRYTSSWEYLVSMWNDNNSNMYVPEDIEMPDYLNKLKTIENVV